MIVHVFVPVTFTGPAIELAALRRVEPACIVCPGELIAVRGAPAGSGGFRISATRPFSMQI